MKTKQRTLLGLLVLVLLLGGALALLTRQNQKAEQAASQGKLVEQANLLHKAGATSESRAVMLWRGALDALRMPSERISSRWLGTEALMLASAPYPSTKALVEDLQLATKGRSVLTSHGLADLVQAQSLSRSTLLRSGIHQTVVQLDVQVSHHSPSF